MGLQSTLVNAVCVLAIVSGALGTQQLGYIGDSASSGFGFVSQKHSSQDSLPAPSALAEGWPSFTHRRLAEDGSAQQQDVCSFYKGGYGTETNELTWGGGHLCTIPEGHKWAQRAAARCRDCMSAANLCERPPRLLIHQYLNHLDPYDWQGNLLSLKAYLLTQDLRKTELILWADDPATIVNNDTRPFFRAFASNIRVRRFNYSAEIEGTPLDGDPYFGSEAAIKASVPKKKPASYSDLVRYILLHNYGGLWIDGDTVLMQDVYGVTVMVGYQFAMRWMNAHVFYVKRRSPLAKRILTTTMAMPLNHPNLATDIVEKVCKPYGYFTVVDFENLTDIWAFCVLRVVARKDNTGPADNILYDQPLGWWDAHWPGSHKAAGCYTNDQPVNDTYFEEYVGKSMALHTRFPGHNGHQPVPGSPLGRAVDVINSFFATCSSRACVPDQALPLLAYLHADGDPAAFPPPDPSAGPGGPSPAAAAAQESGRTPGWAAALAPDQAAGRGKGGAAGQATTAQWGITTEKGGSRSGGWLSVEDPSLEDDDLASAGGAALSGASSNATGSGPVASRSDELRAAGSSNQTVDDLFKPAAHRHKAPHHKNKWTYGH